MNNGWYRTKGWYPFGLVCLRSVFGSECFGACDVLNTSFILVKERQVVSPFVKISFEFSSAFRESVVRRTNTAESKSYAEWNSSLSVFRMT